MAGTRENGPLLSRVVEPPGTKGGPWAGNFPGSPKNTFHPESWIHPRQKAPPFVPGEATTQDKRPFTRDKRACFTSFPPNFMFVFVSFYFSFKIGFYLLIQLIKLWFQKLWNKISYIYINLIHATKIINFHSSDWVNEISNFFEIIFVILIMQKYIRWFFFQTVAFRQKVDSITILTFKKWILDKIKQFHDINDYCVSLREVCVSEIVCVSERV